MKEEARNNNELKSGLFFFSMSIFRTFAFLLLFLTTFVQTSLLPTCLCSVILLFSPMLLLLRNNNKKKPNPNSLGFLVQFVVWSGGRS